MSDLLICRVPDQLGAGGWCKCKWPDGDITLSAVATVPGVSEEDFLELGLDCLHEISRECGITPIIARQARSARILMTVFLLDGPGGVLADSELPCGQVYQCKQRYDLGESWTSKRLRQTMLHEIMHALGLPHAPDGVIAIMSPTLQEQLEGLQPWDIQELRRRYGPPRSLPAPEPKPKPAPAPEPAPQPNGGFFVNALAALAALAPLLKLVAQLAPLITWFAANKDKISGLLDVLRSLADAFATKPQPAMALSIGMSKDDLRQAISNTLPVLADWARRTSWGADDVLVSVLEFAVEHDQIFDWVYAIFSGRETVTTEQVAHAVAQLSA